MTQTPSNSPSPSALPWILAALAAHTGWGAYPVLARYLQTVSDLPSFSLLAAGNALAGIVVYAFFLPRIEWRVFRQPILWLFGVLVLLRAATNILAARYTLSIFVQLITQLTPFVVVLLGATLFRERIPRFTGLALALCLVGALLMMGGDIGRVSAVESRADWLGVSLAAASSVLLAIYMLVVRRTVRSAVPGEAVLVVQVTVIVAVAGPLSLLTESWAPWRAAGPSDWLIFVIFSLGVFLGSNAGQIFALRRLGAPLVSSLIAWRLVSTLLLGALLLDERLRSLWQLAGAALVAVTITWYLRRQVRPDTASQLLPS